MGVAGLIMGTDLCGFAPKRVCDLCGDYREAKPGVFRMVAGRMVCSRHDGWVPAEVLDKAPRRHFKIQPLKNARPFNPRDTYERAEWEVFNFVTENYSTDVFTVPDMAAPVASVSPATFGTGVWGAAWTCIYLYDLIAEDKRTRRMIALARTRLRTVADWLLARQYAAPQVAGVSTDADAWWGGFGQAGAAYPTADTFVTRHTAAAGLALLRAYQALGDSKYLLAARAAIWFCRTMQCTGKLTAGYTSGDSAGSSRLNTGSWTSRATITPGGPTLSPDHYFQVGDLAALEFYVAYKAAIGDETIGSSSTAAVFASSRAATITTAIAEALTFWKAGVYDVTRAAVTNGLTTTTPFQGFNAYPAVKSLSPVGTGSWRYVDAEAATGTYIQAEDWALGIRALRAAGEATLAESLFDWLMTFTSNALHELPEGATEKTKYAAGGTKGTYDPKFALADELAVRDVATATNITTSANVTRVCYSLFTAGLLAPLYSSRQAATFKLLKDSLNVPRHHSVGRGEDGRYHHLIKGGRCGFSLQPTQQNGRFYIPAYAAMTGLIYRQAPQAFLLRGN